MRGEPAADELLADACAALVRRRGGQVAQPGKAVIARRQRCGQRLAGIFKCIHRHDVGSEDEPAAEQLLAAHLVAGDRVLGHCHEAQRRAATAEQAPEERAAADGRKVRAGAGRGIVAAAHAPRRPRILAA